MHTCSFFSSEIEEETVDLHSARGFLIPIPHTGVKNQRTAESHDLLPEKVSIRTAARCLLHTTVGHGCVCVHTLQALHQLETRTHTHTHTHTHKLLITSHNFITSNLLVLAGPAAVSQLFCVNAPSEPLICNGAVSKKTGSAERWKHSTFPFPLYRYSSFAS